MKINRKAKERKKNILSWKAKKRAAEAVCAFVVVLSMLMSLYTPTAHQISENVKNRESVNYRMEENKTSVSLNLKSTQVKEKESEDVTGPVGTALAEQDSQGGKRAGNRVVQDAKQQAGEGKNAVVKNPAPLALISTVFENYGEIPDWDEVETRYQYPVEIGYAVDKNYDGKQKKKDTILNMVMDTIPEEDFADETASDGKEDIEDEDSSEEKEDNDATEDEPDTQDTTEEIDVREEFRKEIWSRLLMTEPVEVEKEEKLQVEEKPVELENENNEEQEIAKETEKEESAESGTDSIPETVTEPKSDEETQVTTEDTDKEVITDAGYYIISGMMRDGKAAFVGDIQIRPSGVDGFNKIRLGENGEFQDFISITEDGVDKELDLYFTDGERITTKTIFTYTKDTCNPEIAVNEEEINVLSSDTDEIYCTNRQEAAVIVKDGEEEESSGLEKISSVYGDKIVCLVDSLENPKIMLPQDFFGRVLLNCEDRAGNTSDIISGYYLTEQNAPEIIFSESEICTAPYRLWIDVEDAGHIISGIDNIECTVNGERYAITDLQARENVQLTDTLKVSSKAGFSIPFEQEGSYRIEVRVTDNAGNITTEEKIIEVTKPELVAVYMPQEFTIHIDPQRLLGREQIFSDNIVLSNVSNVDVKVQVEDVVVKVNEEVSNSGIIKDCDLYLVAPDTGERIKLNTGRNKDVYSYCLPIDAQGEIADFYFVGNTAEGSDAMWRDSDITISVKLSFDKWRE